MPKPRPRVRAVIFDLDDTLYLERDYVRSGFAAVGAALRERSGRTTTFEEWMWGQFVAGRRKNIFNALSRRYRLNLARKDIAELVRVYRDHRPAIRPCRGVDRVLRSLRRRGVRLGALSDGFLPAQRLKLEALGLARMFQATVFTEEMGRDAWKPSPRGFERIRRRLATPHAACAYVADNPGKDFLAPNQLGWLTVRWRRRGQVHGDNPPPAGGAPQRVVRSGPELLELLGR